MDYKTAPVEFKAGKQPGEYEGYFSMFGNVDDGGDVMTAGAFTKTLGERAQAGRSRIKVFYGHDWTKVIGPPPDVLQEDSRGLYAKGRLTLKSFWGNEVYELMADGALTEGSIGYETVKGDYSSEGVRLLKEVKLYEISPVPLGMNPLTTIAAVKALSPHNAHDLVRALLIDIKAGARHSSKDAALLQEIHDMVIELGAMCAAAAADEADEPAEPDDPAKSRAAAPRALALTHDIAHQYARLTLASKKVTHL